MVSKKCPWVTRVESGFEVQSGNMADEETHVLQIGLLEMTIGGFQSRNTKEALAATAACPVTDCKGLYDSLVANVSARTWRERSKKRHRVSVPCEVCQQAMPADGLANSSLSAQRVFMDFMDFLARGCCRLVQDPTFECPVVRHPESRSGARQMPSFSTKSACDAVEPDKYRFDVFEEF